MKQERDYDGARYNPFLVAERMKFFKKFKHINRQQTLIGILFFAVSGVVFYLYAIDFSPLIIAALLVIFAKNIKKLENFPTHLDMALLGALAILITIVPVETFNLSPFAIPAIGFIILITLLFDNLEFSFLFALFISFLSASIDAGNFILGLSLFAGSLTAGMLCYRIRRRFSVIYAGLIAALVQFLTMFAAARLKGIVCILPVDVDLFKICLANGVVSSIVVMGLLPVFEYMFKVVTNISLLEFVDFNHPVLRRLILEAPGTYQHSLAVANLSDAAAESIEANSLLARVGAYYHDIGKMIKPAYFAENQLRFNDAHKDLNPSLSKLIITNHVKDGVELAQKYHVNPRIIDFIQQHHGKTLVYYFYQLAKEVEPQESNEEEYRYPGPKPQTKEIAIVSLADTLEALSRTLDEPTPARIEEMVREVIRKKFMSGDLDESDLTLKDLEKITRKFIHVLNALFHVRVNYPKDEPRANLYNDKNIK